MVASIPDTVAAKVPSDSGESEARDFADLMDIEPQHGFDRLCQLAAEKARGFHLGVFAEMIGRFGRLRRDEFELDDARYEQLARLVEMWRVHAIELANA